MLMINEQKIVEFILFKLKINLKIHLSKVSFIRKINS